jgi:type IV pilus assembly protein PilN
MAHINLLPWREEAQKAKQQLFFSSLIGVVLLAFVLVFATSQYYQARIDGQNARNQYLQNEIKKLDIRIGEIKTLKEKKKALQQRISVIEQLQRSRNVGTQILDEIAKIVPTGIYLTRLEKKGNILLIEGKSESNNHLANMIRAIESSSLLTDATLESISNNDNNSKLLSNFKMKVRIKGLVDVKASKESKKGRK